MLAMGRLGEVWKQLFPEEQVRLVNLLIERVQLLSDSLDIVWREAGWRLFLRAAPPLDWEAQRAIVASFGKPV